MYIKLALKFGKLWENQTNIKGLDKLLKSFSHTVGRWFKSITAYQKK